MSDSLRDRIAAVLNRNIPNLGAADLAVADAVIAELGLRQERFETIRHRMDCR